MFGLEKSREETFSSFVIKENGWEMLEATKMDLRARLPLQKISCSCNCEYFMQRIDARDPLRFPHER